MTSSQLFGLNEATLTALREVFRAHSKIEKVILYGSRAMGNYRAGSDIDLTMIAPAMELDDVLKILDEIEELNLPYKVDLSLFHQLDTPSLVEHIRRVGVDFL